MYDRLDPIGEWREEFRTARLESLIVNIVSQLYSKKGTKPKETKPLDFMPKWDGDYEPMVKEQSVEEMKEILMSWAKANQRRKPATQRKPPKGFDTKKE